MTNQEKELKLFLVKELKPFFNLISQTDTFINDLAKAIISKYPQILGEFIATEIVSSGIKTELLDDIYKKYQGMVINVYCVEVKE